MIRVEVTNEGTEDWRGCIVSLECGDLGDPVTAASSYEAKDLTPKGGASVKGAEGSRVVQCPALTTGWLTVLGSEITGVGHMTHIGPRRMLLRLIGAGVPVEWKLEWRSLGAANWVQTQEGSTPIIVETDENLAQLFDFGECRPERAITGEQRWEWRLQARLPEAFGVSIEPQIRDVYPMSTEQWMRVSDASATPIDGEPSMYAGAVVDAAGVGATAWTLTGGGPVGIPAPEERFAEITLAAGAISHYLEITDFGLPVPAGAAILGVRFGVLLVGLATAAIFDDRVRLIVGGVVKAAEDKASPITWPDVRGPAQWRYYGGNEDTWGQSLIQSDVIATNFGLAIAIRNALGTSSGALIYAATAQVAYSEGGNENRVCFASRSMEFTDSGVRRQHVTDEIWGDLVPEGFVPYAPAPGQAGGDARLLIIPSVGDFDSRPDLEPVDLNVKVTYRPGYLFAREAAEE